MPLLVTYVTFYSSEKYFHIHYSCLSLLQPYDTKQVNNILLLLCLGDTTEISILPHLLLCYRRPSGGVQHQQVKAEENRNLESP